MWRQELEAKPSFAINHPSRLAAAADSRSANPNITPRTDGIVFFDEPPPGGDLHNNTGHLHAHHPLENVAPREGGGGLQYA